MLAYKLNFLSIREFIIHTRLPSQANAQAFAQVLPFISISNAAFQSKGFLSADYLQALKKQFAPNLAYDFVDQDSLRDSRYYEQIIYQDKCIPTRKNSWHDFFNGLMWFQFPRTKAYLNELHWQDIQQFGLKKRTAARDRATHFDECGMVLINDSDFAEASLNTHQWKELFITNRKAWFAAKNGVLPVHFGHANLEMLCKPFIGLTAKVLVINNATALRQSELIKAENNAWTEDSEKIEESANRILGFTETIDKLLLQTLIENNIFEQKKAFRPMPILGIPNWHNAAQDAAFYDNKNYFMPHPSERSQDRNFKLSERDR
uniref:DUF3025 domain-containing protein n=1 Tax=Ningiella ruwaisensis TaxID=2364274 RepID=UPI0010A01AA6|nr:DUF3025 domain-containing protein [Ningiella ruwaisensis]